MQNFVFGSNFAINKFMQVFAIMHKIFLAFYFLATPCFFTKKEKSWACFMMLLNFILYQKNFVNSCKTFHTLSHKTIAICKIRQGEILREHFNQSNTLSVEISSVKSDEKIAWWQNFLPTNIFCRWNFPPTNNFYRRLFSRRIFFTRWF